MRRPSLLLPLALLASLSLAPRRASSNGRFPNAGLVVVGPGARRDVVAVQLTFGVAMSADAGRSWRLLCESAYAMPSGWDPPLALSHDGALHVALLDGLRRTPDGCAWSAPTGAGSAVAIDIAHDATGRNLVLGVGMPGAPNGVMTSGDGGRTWTQGALVADAFLSTVEIAPSDPSRLYAVMNDAAGRPALYRSDDGGRSLRVVTRTFDGNDAWLSAVDPTAPDTLYVRSTLGLTNYLLKSTDGGATFRRIASVDAAMTGFALSDDGATVWIATDDPASPILRAVRGGPFLRTRARATVRCMRHHAGVLYVCGSENVDGWSLACSTDGGDTLDPLLAMRALPPPTSCPPGTPTRDRCEPEWPMHRALLGMITFDGGLTPDAASHLDVPTDAPRDVAIDLPRPDAPDAPDASRDATTDLPRDAAVDLPRDAADASRDAAADLPRDATTDLPRDAAADLPRDATTDLPRDAHDATAPVDAAPPPDSALDAPPPTSPTPPSPRSCACAARAPSPSPAPAPFALAALVALVGRRPRRRA